MTKPNKPTTSAGRYNLVAENPQSTVVAEYTPDKKRASHYQSEAELERAFIEQLESQAYEYLPITDENDLELNNIDVQHDFPKDFPVIIGDKKQIQEVLFNIIRNAAQAMDKKQGKIVVSGFSENSSAVIRIADNGTGIPQDKIAQIFNPFYTTKAPGKGTGLGLFIVKQVVERNKGTIAVESKIGIGTTFTLRFPGS